MIFQHSHEKITHVAEATGEPKTATRRMLKEDDLIITDADTSEIVEIHRKTKTGNYRKLWQVGNKTSVQTGRGKKAIAHIVIDRITVEREEDVTDADAIKEGYATAKDFYDVWYAMHGKPAPEARTRYVYVLEFHLFLSVADVGNWTEFYRAGGWESNEEVRYRFDGKQALEIHLVIWTDGFQGFGYVDGEEVSIMKGFHSDEVRALALMAHVIADYLDKSKKGV